MDTYKLTIYMLDHCYGEVSGVSAETIQKFEKWYEKFNWFWENPSFFFTQIDGLNKGVYPKKSIVFYKIEKELMK